MRKKGFKKRRTTQKGDESSEVNMPDNKAQVTTNDTVGENTPEEFQDEKMEKNFKNFLRILKFKHRKNIMIIHEIDKQIEN